MLHKMTDVYQCKNPKFNNLMGINNFIEYTLKKMQIKAIAPPVLIPFYYGKVAADDGISAFVLLECGHMTLHAFYKRRCMFIDLMYEDYEGTVFDKIIEYKGEYKKEQVTLKTVEIDRDYNESVMSIDHMDRFDEKMVSEFEGFGPHYMASTTLKENLSFEEIYEILQKMPREADMTAISRPFVIKNKMKYQANGGNFISGIIIIAESHISIHYNVDTKKLYFDMFTCRPLPQETMKSVFYNSFKDKMSPQEKVIEALVERGHAHVYSIKKDANPRQTIRSNWKQNTWIDNID